MKHTILISPRGKVYTYTLHIKIGNAYIATLYLPRDRGYNVK